MTVMVDFDFCLTCLNYDRFLYSLESCEKSCVKRGKMRRETSQDV
jgi:hypothetical protein